MTNNLSEYRKYVKFLSQTNENRIFLNSDNEKAIIVFTELFAKAQKIMRIFAGCLSNDVVNNSDYISAVSDFVSRGGEIKILLNKFSEDNAQNSDLLKRLAFYQTEKKPISVHKCNDKPYLTNDEEKKEVHFAIADNSAYRIETDIVNRKSVCNMNDTETGEKLAIFFDGLFENSETIDLVSFFKMK